MSECRRQLNVWVGGKHGPYKYTPALLSGMDKYASKHGVAEATP